MERYWYCVVEWGGFGKRINYPTLSHSISASIFLYVTHSYCNWTRLCRTNGVNVLPFLTFTSSTAAVCVEWKLSRHDNGRNILAVYGVLPKKKKHIIPCAIWTLISNLTMIWRHDVAVLFKSIIDVVRRLPSNDIVFPLNSQLTEMKWILLICGYNMFDCLHAYVPHWYHAVRVHSECMLWVLLWSLRWI